MNVLLTGFEPFGGFRFNPSEAILGEARKWLEPNTSITLHTVVLKSSYEDAGRHIRRSIRRLHPDRVLCFGLSADRPTVRLERVALNLDDSAMADNKGRVRRGCGIVSGGPAAYFSTAPLDRLSECLTARGIPIEISNYAAAFVCNHVYYCALDSIAAEGSGASCLLVHLPFPFRRGHGRRPIGALDWKEIKAVVREIVLEFVSNAPTIPLQHKRRSL